MLVFTSDLHFVDGTAGEHNVPAAASASKSIRVRKDEYSIRTCED